MTSSILDTGKLNAGIILHDCLTAEAAAKVSGYNIQHIRRLAFAGKLEAYKVGRSWLIKVESLESHLKQMTQMADRRFGPRG